MMPFFASGHRLD